jgi:hypothetical protein
MRGSRDSTHNAGSEPAHQATGVHGGHPTLIFELLRHPVCPRLFCGERFRNQSDDDVATDRGG